MSLRSQEKVELRINEYLRYIKKPMKNTDPLVSRMTAQRREKQQKIRQSEKREMDTQQINRETHEFYQSVNVTNDIYMVDALSKVRKSYVTHPEDPTRGNGSWMHNRSFQK